MRTVELFSGCGGMSQGFKDAGFNIVAAYEYWDTAIECYRQNFKHPIYKFDLSDTDAAIAHIRLNYPDIIIGGPPCQDFSTAGKRIESDRADLTSSYAKIIAAILPKFFVMENVDRVIKSDAYKRAREIFKNANYGLSEHVLNASYCGVPQSRKRLICIGALNESDGFATKYLTDGLSSEPMTLRHYFGNSLDFEYYYRHPRNYSRRAIFSIDEPAPTIRGVNRPIPKGYAGNSGDACDVDECKHSLTTLERSLIQTFPPTFQWVGSKTEIEQMIGNAVPVKLAEFVANAITQYVKDNKSHIVLSDSDGFTKWMIDEQGYSARSAKDVISRLKRADELCSSVDPDDIFTLKIDHNEDYNNLSVSVKCQLKKAVQLYNKYYDYRNRGSSNGRGASG